MHRHKWCSKIFSWGPNILWIENKVISSCRFHHMSSDLLRLLFFSIFSSLKSCMFRDSVNANQYSNKTSTLQFSIFHYDTLLNIGGCVLLVPCSEIVSVGFWIAMSYIINLDHKNMCSESQDKCLILWWDIWIIKLMKNFSLTYLVFFEVGDTKNWNCSYLKK